MTTDANPLQQLCIEGVCRAASKPFMIADNTSDEELMVAIVDRHDEAMRVLYDRYIRLVYSISWKLVRDFSEAEDLTQDVFLELFRNAHRFHPAEGAAKSWILWLTYRRGINRRKHLADHKFYDHEGPACPDVENLETHHSPKRLTEIAESDFLMIMSKGMEGLSANERATLSLVIVEGYTLPEAASHLGLSLGNVTHYYYRGLEKFRAAVDE